jgi:hypothetical protein
MKLVILIPALISGFIYCHLCIIEFYRLHRYQGQYLYLRCAAFGLGFLVISTLIALLLHNYIPDSIQICSISISLNVFSYIKHLFEPIYGTDSQQLKETSFLFEIIFIMMIMSFSFALIQNKRLKRNYGNSSNVRNLTLLTSMHNSASDSLLTQSLFDARIALLITLSSQKVYVAVISEIPLPNESEKLNEEIKIIPLMSGYRTSKTKKVKLPNDYLNDLPDEIDQNNFAIAINKKDIISISLFDFALNDHLMTKPSQFTHPNSPKS